MENFCYDELGRLEDTHWWFVGRRTIIQDVLTRLAPARKARILEIGSGTGGNLGMLSAFGSVCAVETNDQARALSTQRATGADIRAGHCPTAMPFPGERFDLICLFDVLEHIKDDLGALRMLHSIAAPGGKVVITVPAFARLWSTHDEVHHHQRRYHLGELRQLASQAGWSVHFATYFNFFLFPVIAVARLFMRTPATRESTHLREPAPLFNRLLAKLFGAERYLLRRMRLPLGVSILLVLTQAAPPSRLSIT